MCLAAHSEGVQLADQARAVVGSGRPAQRPASTRPALAVAHRPALMLEFLGPLRLLLGPTLLLVLSSLALVQFKVRSPRL